MPARIPDHTRAAILDDIRAGQKSRAQIARDHEVSPWTVGNIAKQANIEGAFSREKTKNATTARVADAAAIRTKVATSAIGVAQHFATKARRSPDGVEAKNWAIAYGIFVDKHLALVKHDADPGTDAARSMLGELGRALGTAANLLGQEPPEPQP